MIIRSLVIDDEPNARKALVNMIGFYCPDLEVCGEAQNVAEGYDLIRKIQPDLVFLDIRMPDGTGFELLRKFKKITFRLIVVTAYNEYALKAIKFSALDYLQKPVDPSELIKSVGRARSAMETEEMLDLKIKTYLENINTIPQSRKIILNTTTNIHVIEVGDIVRCEADENYTIIYLESREKIIVAKTLKEFEEMLSGYGFYRIHQSHLINMQTISSYEKGRGGIVVLKDNSKLPVSARRKDGFIRCLESI
ncbi:MAG: LytTR family DNA-binding domain-containing protein [Bacteroidales bacterium]|nr:LytTR family DNA-binding domain-containing protein [Bacteroidales bacterium]